MKHPSHKPRRHRLLVLSLLAIATLLAASSLPLGARPPTVEPPSRRALCETLSSGSNPFFGAVVSTEAGTHASPEDRLRQAQHDLQQGRFAEALQRIKQFAEDGQSTTLQQRTEAHWTAGLANLRLGEAINCLAPLSTSPASEHQDAELHDHPSSQELSSSAAPSACIVPLEPEALHRNPQPARAALHHFLAILQAEPRNATAAWLANLAATLAGETDTVSQRYALSLSAPRSTPGAQPPWRNIAGPLGVDQVDLAGGAALEDLDGDGFLDIITTTWDPCGGITVFRNEGTNGFRDVTTEWGLADTAGGLNLFTADYDGDGRVDLFITRGAWLLSEGMISNSLLRNEPSVQEGAADAPRFRDVTVEVGLAQPAAPTQAAVFADFDNDGDLDLYLGNEATAASPHNSQLFRNDAVTNSKAKDQSNQRRFVDVAAVAGVRNLRYTKAVAAGDVDNDGDQDLYVSNFGINRLYLNQFAETGNLTFIDRAPELEVKEPVVQSFATWFFDYDNDGDLDLFVADYQQQPDRVAASYFAPASFIGRTQTSGGQPLLYRNLLAQTGELRFETSTALGLGRPAMPMGANFGDLDGDGFLDLYLGTGEPNLASQFPNQAYRNRQGSFEEITMTAGLGHLQKGHGVAFGDLDHDGDQDLLHQLGGFYPGDTSANALFENLSQGSSRSHRWLILRFEGRTANRFAVGARVGIQLEQDLQTAGKNTTKTTTLHRTVGTGGSFGASSLQLEVGLGNASRIRSVTVDWPGGGSQTFDDLTLDAVYRLVEGGAKARRIDVVAHQMLATDP